MVILGYMIGFTKTQQEEPKSCPKSIIKGESSTHCPNIEDQMKLQRGSIDDERGYLDVKCPPTGGVEYARIDMVVHRAQWSACIREGASEESSRGCLFRLALPF